MPNGKVAGERCIHLLKNNFCALFNSPNRPEVCGSYLAEEWLCGGSREEALHNIMELEAATA